MPFVDGAVPEERLDYGEIFRRGGRNYGDEDFALCKCPGCGQIYLIEYEVDTIYLDATDLARRQSVFTDAFECVHCGQLFSPESAWIGPKAPPEMQVTWTELRNSPWRWIAQQTRAD